MRAVAAALLQQTSGTDAARRVNEETDRAMAWLNQAVTAGYKDSAHMAKDADLDVLRDREDFKKLSNEMAGPTGTKRPRRAPAAVHREVVE